MAKKLSVRRAHYRTTKRKNGSKRTSRVKSSYVRRKSK